MPRFADLGPTELTHRAAARYVSDGYGNTRVAKFDKTGKFLMT